VPQSNPGFCRLILEHRQTVNLQLHDISLSGFSMLNDVKEVSRLLLAGGSFSECKLILPEAGECMISFIVGNKLVISPDNSRRIQKIGCKFINITATDEETIHRYMYHIQRENLRLESTRRLADKVF
jgi:c-di-GMP-binding flagellar brake protein YcgR